MSVSTGSTLYAYVYLDPANPPTQVMLQWSDGSWDHRAYWGASQLNYGLEGTAGRRYMGPLPAAGQWVQLKVPARDVALEGRTVTGMAFTLFNGRATWDAAGVLNPNVSTNPPSSGTNPDSGTTTNTVSAVSVTATDASRVGPASGTFTFTRTGSTSNSLTLTYALSGTAASGTDYTLSSGQASASAVVAPNSVTIPAGSTSATLTVSPVTNVASAQTVVLTIASNSTYTVAAPGSATMNIAGNVVSAPSLTVNTGGTPALSWPSTNGAVYRIAYKENLTDTNWTFVSSNVTANGSTTSWTDNDKRPQRFYMIQRVQ
jgi:hypothetical protein